MRTLVWGAGAIGGTLGAYLARTGGDLTLVDTVVEHVDAITRDGLRITGLIDEFSLDALVAHNRRSAKSHSGIWRDLAVRKRPTEVDAQLGIVVTLGPTPECRRRSPRASWRWFTRSSGARVCSRSTPSTPLPPLPTRSLHEPGLQRKDRHRYRGSARIRARDRRGVRRAWRARLGVRRAR